MSDSGEAQPGWWMASDGRWYPPESRPFPPPMATVAMVPAAPSPGAGAQTTSTVFNLLWLVLAGIWLCVAYVVAGIVSCVTIIGIPFGIQSFKLAGYALWPFGRVVIDRPGRDAGLSCLGNVIWFFLCGLHLAVLHVVAGLLLCATIVGIPLGVGSFKMAGLAIAPFGKQVVSRRALASMPQVVVVSQFG